MYLTSIWMDHVDGIITIFVSLANVSWLLAVIVASFQILKPLLVEARVPLLLCILFDCNADAYPLQNECHLG